MERFTLSRWRFLRRRRTVLQQMKEAGMPGAATALLIRQSPERHLTTARLFMTLMGIFAAVLAGWLVVHDVSPWLDARWPFAAGGSWVLASAIILVTAALTYVALVAGQIVPRALAPAASGARRTCGRLAASRPDAMLRLGACRRGVVVVRHPSVVGPAGRFRSRANNSHDDRGGRDQPGTGGS